MADIVEMSCVCGYIGNRLSKEWIDIEIVTNSNFKKQKAYTCPKCGTVRVVLQ